MPESDKHNCMKKAADVSYHGFDFLTTWFIGQTLIARFLITLFSLLNKYEKAPSLQTQEGWLGIPIICISIVNSFILNYLNHKNKANYPAYQDYYYSLFSSSIIFIALKNLSLNDQEHELPTIITIAVILLTPFLSYRFSKSVITDSTNKIQNHLDEDDAVTFQTYLEASQLEKTINALSGASYGASAMSTFFWTLNREMQGRTVDNRPWQLPIIIIFSLLGGFQGYQLTSHPRSFNTFASISKVIKNTALSYAALSGMFFVLLNLNNYCQNGLCEENIRTPLFAFSAILTFSIGIRSGLYTRFHFEDNHTSCISTDNLVKKIFQFFNCRKSENEEEKIKLIA